MKTDQELKQLIAEMLPDKIEIKECITCGLDLLDGECGINDVCEPTIVWLHNQEPIKDTELLSLCWMVEETLTKIQWDKYGYKMCLLSAHPYCEIHATPGQKITALAEVKGVEV